MIIIRQDTYNMQGWIICDFRRSCTYLGHDLAQALITAHSIHPTEDIWLDATPALGNYNRKDRKVSIDDLHPVEFVNEVLTK